MTRDTGMLATHVVVFRQVKERIAADAGLAEDDEAVIDSTEGETDLADYLTRLLRTALDAQAQAAGLDDLIKQRQERKARLQAKHDKLKAIVLHAMADAGLPKLSAPDFSATRSRSQPGVVITADATAIPDQFCRVSREPDKKAIGAALKDGKVLPFASLGNAAESLTIRGS